MKKMAIALFVISCLSACKKVPKELAFNCGDCLLTHDYSDSMPTKYEAYLPGPTWVCGAYSFEIYYTPDTDGLQQIINDAENCRSKTGDGVLVVMANSLIIQDPEYPGPEYAKINLEENTDNPTNAWIVLRPKDDQSALF